MSFIKRTLAFFGVLSILTTYNFIRPVYASEASEEASSEVSSVSITETAGEDSLPEDTDSSEQTSEVPETADDDYSDMKSFNLKELYMSISIPSDIMIVTRDTPSTDEVFTQLKESYTSIMEDMKTSNYYLLAYAPDYSYQITVEMYKDDESKDIYDFSLLTGDQLRAVKDSLVNSGMYHAVTNPPHPQAIFFNLGIEYKGKIKTYYAAQSYTVVNGMHITITFQTFSGHDLTDEQYLMASKILKSVHFDKITDKPGVVDNTDQYIIIAVIIILIIGVGLALVIVLTMYRKNTKTLQSMEDELESAKPSENDLTLKDVIKKIIAKLRKKKSSDELDDDDFIYDFDYSYIDNSDTEFDISIDDINTEIEKSKSSKPNIKPKEKADSSGGLPKSKPDAPVTNNSNKSKNNNKNSKKNKKRKITNYDVFNS